MVWLMRMFANVSLMLGTSYNMVSVPCLETGSSGGVNELAPDRLQFEQ